ncbi:type II toxin-antitoxin system RelE/ParE family toxin, partial [Rhodovulum sulfidophilum]|nr:type II toxin-antitoxin system RelE/ParE family toxin [Rhodovulum sulfidophilum]
DLRRRHRSRGHEPPGLRFSQPSGHTPTRYTVHVNRPWCITFEFRDGDAYVLDYEQYH